MGGQLIAALSAQIDEWTLSVVPTLLGNGIPLFLKVDLVSTWRL